MRSLIISFGLLIILFILSIDFSLAQNAGKWTIPAGGNSYLIKQEPANQASNQTPKQTPSQTPIQTPNQSPKRETATQTATQT